MNARNGGKFLMGFHVAVSDMFIYIQYPYGESVRMLMLLQIPLPGCPLVPCTSTHARARHVLTQFSTVHLLSNLRKIISYAN